MRSPALLPSYHWYLALFLKLYQDAFWFFHIRCWLSCGTFRHSPVCDGCNFSVSVLCESHFWIGCASQWSCRHLVRRLIWLYHLRIFHAFSWLQSRRNSGTHVLKQHSKGVRTPQNSTLWKCIQLQDHHMTQNTDFQILFCLCHIQVACAVRKVHLQFFCQMRF